MKPKALTEQVAFHLPWLLPSLPLMRNILLLYQVTSSYVNPFPGLAGSTPSLPGVAGEPIAPHPGTLDKQEAFTAVILLHIFTNPLPPSS